MAADTTGPRLRSTKEVARILQCTRCWYIRSVNPHSSIYPALHIPLRRTASALLHPAPPAVPASCAGGIAHSTTIRGTVRSNAQPLAVPARSWFWPPRPGEPSLTTPPTVSIDQHNQPPSVIPTSVQHPASTDSWAAQHTDPGWHQRPGTLEWSTPHYITSPSWVVQQWHTTQQWFWGHAEGSWSGHWG